MNDCFKAVTRGHSDYVNDCFNVADRQKIKGFELTKIFKEG